LEPASLCDQVSGKDGLSILKHQLRIGRARYALKQTTLNLDHLLGIRAIHHDLFGRGLPRLRQSARASLAEYRFFQ